MFMMVTRCVVRGKGDCCAGRGHWCASIVLLQSVVSGRFWRYF